MQVSCVCQQYTLHFCFTQRRQNMRGRVEVLVQVEWHTTHRGHSHLDEVAILEDNLFINVQRSVVAHAVVDVDCGWEGNALLWDLALCVLFVEHLARLCIDSIISELANIDRLGACNTRRLHKGGDLAGHFTGHLVLQRGEVCGVENFGFFVLVVFFFFGAQVTGSERSQGNSATKGLLNVSVGACKLNLRDGARTTAHNCCYQGYTIIKVSLLTT